MKFLKATGQFCGALFLAVVASSLAIAAEPQASNPAVQKLREEVSNRGWLLFSGRNPGGDYDLFLCRPDGSAARNVTQTPEWTEFGGRFSPDSKRMLYRRLPKNPQAKPGHAINHDLWGATGELVIANADGSSPVVLGKDGELPWASWSPDSKQFACLYKKEGKIRIVDVTSKSVVKEMPREGIFQQLFWSPDGKRLCGTANQQGRDWNIVALDLDSGKVTQVSRNLCCTPDWFQGDPARLIYSCRVEGVGSDYGWTMLMQASADGKERNLVYGERGRHIYYGCTSPDDKYVVFAVPENDGGTDAELAVARLADTPIIVPDDYKPLQALYPNARSGPALRLGLSGFEPHWTYAELGGR
jgi:Tol biopolymer transport system component